MSGVPTGSAETRPAAAAELAAKLEKCRDAERRCPNTAHDVEPAAAAELAAPGLQSLLDSPLWRRGLTFRNRDGRCPAHGSSTLLSRC